MGELAGQPNLFEHKIWTSQMPDTLSANALSAVLVEFARYNVIRKEKFGASMEIKDVCPKIHTIRQGNRWKAGMKIHPVINNRNKNRFQFAPVMECVSVQEIEIYKGIILIDNKVFYDEWISKHCPDRSKLNFISKLAINDGFPSVEAFFQYFNTDFTGQIIHWTDLNY